MVKMFAGLVALGVTYAAPTPSPTSCVSTYGKCDGRSFSGDTHCCDSDMGCFVKDESYSECLPTCPSDTGWACDTSPPTSSPTSCISAYGKCGGRSFSGDPHCCDSNMGCFVKDESYSECLPTCPSGTGWACDTSPPTSLPTSLPTHTPSSTLREAGTRRGMLIGGVVKYKNLISDEDGAENYTEIMQREFNLLTAENGCKWRYANTKNHLWCDSTSDFASGTSASFRLHALVWGKASSNPDFFCEDCVDPLPSYCDSYVGNWSKADKRRIMIEHVTNHSLRYRGKVFATDVVNEAICDCTPNKYETCADYLAAQGDDSCGYSELYNTYLKKNIYWPDIPDYIGLALNTAKATNPEARVGYNDYKFEAGTGWQAEKSRNVYNLMQSLLAQNVSIDYVGSQTHISLDYANFTGYLSGVRNYTRSLGDLGLEVDFTEVTVACDEDCTDTWDTHKETTQASLYKGLLGICVEEPSCSVFQIWGGIDGWSNAYSGLRAYPFDVNYQPKEAWYAMMDILDGTTTHMSRWDTLQTNSALANGHSRGVKLSMIVIWKGLLVAFLTLAIAYLALHRATSKILTRSRQAPVEKRRQNHQVEVEMSQPFIIYAGKPVDLPH